MIFDTIKFPFLALLLLLSSGFLPGQTISSELAIMPATVARDFGYLPLTELNRAALLERDGRMEEALMLYESALTRQPDWIPALAAKATLLNRVGRDAEARQTMKLALRIDPLATNFYTARQQYSLLPFIALFPWAGLNEEGIGLTSPEVVAFSDFHLLQRDRLASAADTSLVVQAVRSKLDRASVTAARKLDTYVQDRRHEAGLAKLLNGNLALLNQDYDAAIALYTDAILKDNTRWPELYYNRGLAYLQLQLFPNGCEDLRAAADQDFRPAELMMQSLCNF